MTNFDMLSDEPFLGTTNRDWHAVWAAHYGGIARAYMVVAMCSSNFVWENAAVEAFRNSIYHAKRVQGITGKNLVSDLTIHLVSESLE